MSEKLLTAADVAERLAVTERYVWRLGREGRLTRVKVGKYVRFRETDIDTFIEESIMAPDEPKALHVEPSPGKRKSATDLAIKRIR